MKEIKIYTDGACSGNQNESNIGGWGAILEYGEHTKELYGGEPNTTNNRMEMMALLNALSALKKEGQTISVFSDSSYLMNCFREKWYINWKKNNWKTSKKTDVENRDLWEALLALVEKHNIKFYRVKGHVNLESKSTNFNALYKKFKEWNGDFFTYEDFLYITEKNNRADALANLGMEPFRL
ncbi:MAG: ribonuclease H [Anaerovorax sp.]|nr:ribonuclease H [Anaerovorax sp.]